MASSPLAVYYFCCLPLFFGSSIGCCIIKVLSIMFGIIYNRFLLYIVNVLNHLLSFSCEIYQPLISVTDIPVDIKKSSNDFIWYLNMICLLKQLFIFFHYLFIKFLSAPYCFIISKADHEAGRVSIARGLMAGQKTEITF